MKSILPDSAIVAILAGGKAQRFGGRDKGEILIDGQRLIDIIHARLKPQATEIMLSGYRDYGLRLDVVPDGPKAPDGPVGGIYSIWKYLEGRDVEGFFTAAVDGPNIPKDLTVLLYAKDNSSVACDEKGRHPTYAWWRMADLAQVFRDIDISQSISLNRLAEHTAAKDVTWFGNKNFVNINRPEDLDGL